MSCNGSVDAIDADCTGEIVRLSCCDDEATDTPALINDKRDINRDAMPFVQYGLGFRYKPGYVPGSSIDSPAAPGDRQSITRSGITPGDLNPGGGTAVISGSDRLPGGDIFNQ